MSPGDPRRPIRSPECCFLPDLTRFGGGRRAGPELIRGPGSRRLPDPGGQLPPPSVPCRTRAVAPGPIRVFFLWHFHQPWYPELDGSPARLPWVRLHALKDYADLPALFSEDPRVPHAANLVPSLLDQLELVAGGGRDVFLDLATTPVPEWDGTAVDFALENFFSVHPRAMAAFPHFSELLRRKIQ